MAKQEVATGYTKNGLPYVRMGSNPRKLVICSDIPSQLHPGRKYVYS